MLCFRCVSSCEVSVGNGCLVQGKGSFLKRYKRVSSELKASAIMRCLSKKSSVQNAHLISAKIVYSWFGAEFVVKTKHFFHVGFRHTLCWRFTEAESKGSFQLRPITHFSTYSVALLLFWFVCQISSATPAGSPDLFRHNNQDAIFATWFCSSLRDCRKNRSAKFPSGFPLRRRIHKL